MLVTTSHQEGQRIEVSFDKEALKLLPEVVSHPVFANEANWDMVSIVFKNPENNDRFVSGFKGNFTQTDTVKMNANMQSGDSYELHKIIFSGENREPLFAVLNSSISNASSMGLTIAGGVSQPSPIVWDTLLYNGQPISTAEVPYIVEADGGISGGPISTNSWARASQQGVSGSSVSNFDFVIDGIVDEQGFAFGLAKDNFSTHVGFWFYRPSFRYPGGFIPLVDPNLNPFTGGNTVDLSATKTVDLPTWNLSGPNTLRVQISNGFCKLFVNGVEYYTNSQPITIDPNGTYYPVARLHQNYGIYSSSKL